MSQRQAKRQRREETVRRVGVARSHPELVAKLRDQIGYLRKSAAMFDEGDESEAPRLAVSLRILFHDSGSGESLFSQLHLGGIRLPDSSQYDPRNLVHGTNLVSIEMCGDRPPAYRPRLGAHGLPLRWRPVGSWWTAPAERLSAGGVMSAGSVLTREDMVRMVADKEGGAHVDPEMHPDYAAVLRENAWGWSWGRGSAMTRDSSPIPGNPVFASLRQISWEVLEGLASSEEVRKLLATLGEENVPRSPEQHI